jgi:hypothetical protein
MIEDRVESRKLKAESLGLQPIGFLLLFGRLSVVFETSYDTYPWIVQFEHWKERVGSRKLKAESFWLQIIE